MKKRKVVLGLVQTKPGPEPAANLERARDLVRAAARKGAQLVCLPELYRTAFFPQAEGGSVEHLAETVPGESTEVFSALARELKVVVVLPLFERAADRTYDSVAVLDADGRLLGTYRKVHVPHSQEKTYFAPGDLGFKVFKTRYANFSTLIGFDQWFPEAARASVLAGAEILFYPTATGSSKGRKDPGGDWREAWVTIQRGHAIANGVHVAPVNRAGVEGGLKFFGSSFVADAFGNVLERAGASSEEVLVVPVDLSSNRQEGRGFLSDRRPDSYGSLVRS